MEESLEVGLTAEMQLDDDKGFQMVSLFLLRALKQYGPVTMTKEQMLEAAEIGLEKLVMNCDRETGIFTAALKVE